MILKTTRLLIDQICHFWLEMDQICWYYFPLSTFLVTKKSPDMSYWLIARNIWALPFKLKYHIWSGVPQKYT